MVFEQRFAVVDSQLHRRNSVARFYLYWRENIKEAKERRETVTGIGSIVILVALECLRRFHFEILASKELTDQVIEILEGVALIYAAGWLFLWCPFARYEEEQNKFEEKIKAKDALLDDRKNNQAIGNTLGKYLKQLRDRVEEISASEPYAYYEPYKAWFAEHKNAHDPDTSELLREIKEFLDKTYSSAVGEMFNKRDESVVSNPRYGVEVWKAIIKDLDARVKNLEEIITAKHLAQAAGFPATIR